MSAQPIGAAPHHRYLGWSWERALSPYQNVSDPLRRWAALRPDLPCLTEVAAGGTIGETVTYRRMWERVRAVATLLAHDLKVRPGTRVGVLPRNSAASIAAILAIAHLGAESVLMNRRDPAARLIEQRDASGAEVVLSDGETELGGHDIDDLVGSAPAGSPPERRADAGPSRTAFVLFTTGSTASSKAVLQAHYNVLVNSTSLAEHHRLAPGRRFLGVLPISYANGLGLTVIANLIGGSHVYLLDGFDPLTYLSTASECRAHVASLVPSMLASLAQVRSVPVLDDLAYFISAAAPLRGETSRAVHERLNKRIAQGYGLTETTNFSTTMPVGLPQRWYAGWMLETEIPPVGGALLGNEVAVLDDSGHVLPDGAEGEVCMRGHSVMLGYERNEAANAEALRGGWFHSGDTGVFRMDPVTGHRLLTLTGRLKNIVKVGGAAISLDEVDRAVLAMPGVRDAVALGVEDAHTGERVVVQVVAEPHGGLGAQEVMDTLGDVLPKGLAPVRVEFVSELSRTSNGKVLRSLNRPASREGDRVVR